MNAETRQILEKYDLLFKDIFKDISHEGNNILIDFSNAKEIDLEPEFTMILVRVNECRTPVEFESKLFLITNAAYKRLKQIKNINKHEFLQYAQINLKLLEDLIWYRKIEKKNKTYTLFKDYKLKDEQGEIFDDFLEINYIDFRFFNEDFFFKSFSLFGAVWLKTIRDLKSKIDGLIKKAESETDVAIRGSYKREEQINEEAIEEDEEVPENRKAKKGKKYTSDIVKSSYELINKDADIKKIVSLYQKLKVKGFIDKNTQSEDFKAIFTGTIKRKVNWIGTGGQTELLYLLHCLWGKKENSTQYIIKPNRPYKIINSCFTINGNNININSAKSTYSKILKEEIIPSTARAIDLIIENLK